MKVGLQALKDALNAAPLDLITTTEKDLVKTKSAFILSPKMTQLRPVGPVLSFASVQQAIPA